MTHPASSTGVDRPESAWPGLGRQIVSAADGYPDRVAVTAPDEEPLTYGGLTERAERLADELGSTDLSRVAITGTPGSALVIALVAASLARLRVLLLDSSLPLARREAMLERMDAEVLLVAGGSSVEEGSTIGDVPIRGVAATGVLSAELPAHGSRSSGAGHRDTETEFVFFTSGTTATPKAVLGSSDAVSHFVNWQIEEFQIGAEDRFAQLTPLSFDVVLRDLFTPLVAGARICVPPEETELYLREGGVVDWISEAGITALHVVPSLAMRWVNQATETVSSSLRITIFGGEPLHSSTVRRWQTTFDRTRVVNMCGSTETTLASFWYEGNTAEGAQPVGRTLPGVELRLVKGEVVVRKPHPPLGYLDDAEETERRFVTLPGEGPGWYLTGDLGEISAEGLLFLRGRVDHQIKINGNRIEPDGVAAVIRENPTIADAVVVTHEQDRGDASSRYLVAHITKSSDCELTVPELEKDLRSWLTARLPIAHLPRLIDVRDELPLGPNGKVDRSALLSPTEPTAGSVL